MNIKKQETKSMRSHTQTVGENERFGSCDKLTQCMIGRDAECNHPKCPVSDKDMEEGRYCKLPLYDWRE